MASSFTPIHNLREGIEKVILNQLPIHEIASHWVLHNTALCHNLFTFQVGVVPHISLSLQAKGFFVARRWIVQHLEKKHENIAEAVTN